jgi:hypothetical protein
MPRPKLRSDDEILDAAVAVLRDRGPLAFTLSDVAGRRGPVARGADPALHQPRTPSSCG